MSDSLAKARKFADEADEFQEKISGVTLATVNSIGLLVESVKAIVTYLEEACVSEEEREISGSFLSRKG